MVSRGNEIFAKNVLSLATVQPLGSFQALCFIKDIQTQKPRSSQSRPHKKLLQVISDKYVGRKLLLQVHRRMFWSKIFFHLSSWVDG